MTLSRFTLGISDQIDSLVPVARPKAFQSRNGMPYNITLTWRGS